MSKTTFLGLRFFCCCCIIVLLCTQIPVQNKKTAFANSKKISSIKSEQTPTTTHKILSRKHKDLNCLNLNNPIRSSLGRHKSCEYHPINEQKNEQAIIVWKKKNPSPFHLRNKNPIKYTRGMRSVLLLQGFYIVKVKLKESWSWQQSSVWSRPVSQQAVQVWGVRSAVSKYEASSRVL